MAKPSPTIVKIQKALFPPTGPTLIYDQQRSFQIEVPFGDLPHPIARLLRVQPKVYWRVIPVRDSELIYLNQAPPQPW